VSVVFSVGGWVPSGPQNRNQACSSLSHAAGSTRRSRMSGGVADCCGTHHKRASWGVARSSFSCLANNCTGEHQPKQQFSTEADQRKRAASGWLRSSGAKTASRLWLASLFRGKNSRA
jgi:predicted alpha/beta-hydrolase family hydrolase